MLEIVVCSLIVLGLVFPFYVLPRRVRSLPRNDPLHVKWRFLSLIVSSVVCATFTYSVYFRSDDFIRVVGLHSFQGSILSSINCVALTCFLFLGPIVTKSIKFCSLQHSITYSFLENLDTSHYIYIIRAVVVGPVIEEFIFRGLITSIFRKTGYSRLFTVFGSPWLFGIAHLHSYFNLVKQGNSKTNAALRSLFQMLYTSLFGFIATFFFLRTGHLLPCILSHSLCNTLGLPDTSFTNKMNSLNSYKFAISISYVIGISLFFGLLFPLTDHKLFQSAH